MRRTKIISTVGPASDADDVLDAMIAAGTDIFRLNFSHGTPGARLLLADDLHRRDANYLKIELL
jgi:pyruvate kinase